MFSLPRIVLGSAVATALVAAASVSTISADRATVLAQRVDVAMDGSSFSFEGPVTETGVPANGTPFVVRGYVYPGGTFDQFGDLSGVLPDGSPEFPERVLGSWICRGWHLQDGDAITGPIVVTTQTFDFDTDSPGSQLIVTDGVELADTNLPFSRAITGATGVFEGLEGRNTQVNRPGGVNDSGGFNVSFQFELRP